MNDFVGMMRRYFEAKDRLTSGQPSDRGDRKAPPAVVSGPVYSGLTGTSLYQPPSPSLLVRMNAMGLPNSGALPVSAGMDPSFSGLEFAAGTAKGARSFRVDELGRLTGIHFPQVWTPGENVAECRASEPHKEGGFPDCRCGFYGYYDGSNNYYRAGYISGVVEGYGEAVMGSRGFRVMKARIVALSVDSNVPVNVAYLVRRNYASIPQFDSFARMVAEFPTDCDLRSPGTDLRSRGMDSLLSWIGGRPKGIPVFLKAVAVAAFLILAVVPIGRVL